MYYIMKAYKSSRECSIHTDTDGYISYAAATKAAKQIAKQKLPYLRRVSVITIRKYGQVRICKTYNAD